MKDNVLCPICKHDCTIESTVCDGSKPSMQQWTIKYKCDFCDKPFTRKNVRAPKYE